MPALSLGLEKDRETPQIGEMALGAALISAKAMIGARQASSTYRPEELVSRAGPEWRQM
jgi:hypothetical protein